MHVRTLVNHVYPLKGFVLQEDRWNRDLDRIELVYRARKGSQPICPRCGRQSSTYDHLRERMWFMIPLLTVAVVILYRKRRVNCPVCGVHAEQVPWETAQKSPLTTAYAHHLAGWSRLLSWKEVAARFGITWDLVARGVEYVVGFGLQHRDLSGVGAIGVDEIAVKKGHHYETLVYQIDAGAKRLLWIGHERTKRTFRQFFDMLGTDRAKEIRVVCSDMWKPYLDVIAERIPHALNILDRFHIVAKLNLAVDETRRDEVRRLVAKGEPASLKKTRWIWLKKLANLTVNQQAMLSELLKVNLRTVKAYLLKESFVDLWEYTSPYWARRFLDGWCKQAMRHRSLPQIKKFVGTIRSHRTLILNYFEAKSKMKQRFSSGIVEGMNNKAKLCIRKSFGFRTVKYRHIALFHAMGDLPEPAATHRFG